MNVRSIRAASLAVLLAVLSAGFVFAKGSSEGAGAAAKTYNIKYFGIRYIPEQKTDMIKEIEKKLGVTFEIMGAYDTEYITKISPLLAANDMPDIFSPWQSEDLMAQGAATITEAELQKYMPDYWKGASAVSEGLGIPWQTTLNRFKRDGKLVQFPSAWFTGQFPAGVLWRKDMLEALGKKVPATLADWEDVFKAYKAKYPDKFPYGGCGKLDWQSFTPVTNAAGVQMWHWNMIDGKLVNGKTLPQIKDVLQVLANWQKAGYLHPEWPTWDQPTKYNHFYNGEFLVTEWVSRYPTDDPLYPNSAQFNTRKLVPTATFVYSPYPTLKAGVKPSVYVWNPFTGGSTAFGKKLEKDPDKLHKCMQVLNQLGYDKETLLLAVYGTEGKHWTWDENKLPKRLPGAITQEEQTKLGIGYYWQTLYGFSQLSDDLAMHPMIAAGIQNYALKPGALYSQQNINWHFDRKNGPYRGPSGEDLQAKYAVDLDAKFQTTFFGIVTGQLPLSAFDDWVKYYNEHGGKELDESVNRLYLKQWL